ncbi:hypothetical protein ACQ4PT_058409 [Festuca glaucescens]
MAAGSALPLVAGIGAGNRQSSKDLGAYDPSPAILSGEELALGMNAGSNFGSWRDVAPNRSGSAPPSMEGSLAELDHLIGKHSGDVEATLRNLSSGADSSESEELCSDPTYIKYYGSKVNLNPRLAAPRVSKESRRLTNRFSKSGVWMPVFVGDRSSGCPLNHRSTLSTHKEEAEDDRSAKLDLRSAEDSRCDLDQTTSNMGSHRSELVGLMQENFPRDTALYDNSSGSSNTGDGGSVCSSINSAKNSPVDIVKSSDLIGFPPDTNQRSPRPTAGPLRNTLSSKGNPSVETKSGGPARAMLNGVDSTMKNLKISLDTQHSAHVLQKWQNNAFVQNGPSHGYPIQMSPQGINLSQVPFVDNFSYAHMNLHSGDIQLLSQYGMTTPFYAHNPYYHNSQLPGVLMPPYGIDGHGLPGSFLPPFMTNFAPQLPVMSPSDTPHTHSFSGRLAGFTPTGTIAVGTEFSNPFKIYEQLDTMLSSLPDLSFIHHLRQPSMYHYGHGNPYDTVSSSSNIVGNGAAVFGSENVMSETMRQSGQKFQFPDTGACSSPATKRAGSYVRNHQSTSPCISMPMSYPTSPLFQSQPSSGTYQRDRRNDALGFQSSSETMGLNLGTQGQQGREKSDPRACSFVGEVKLNKNHIVDLTDIKGHIVEYSSDQNGSRFIQQKLENCTTEEKALVFSEILPHASSLMTDVFGNYVIQKALEAVELDQKIALVRELDGHVLRCVRDQNGNHVIQKCIECVPMEHTRFLVSAFQGQVANLSTHPYGCRVIQRILEHCSDYSEGIIDEILKSACILAQDQYGNYVTQVMMKDRFANYVVQKILETCNEQLREALLGRMKCHVQALKKYTYGKHIASRIEQLSGDGVFSPQLLSIILDLLSEILFGAPLEMFPILPGLLVHMSWAQEWQQLFRILQACF